MEACQGHQYQKGRGSNLGYEKTMLKQKKQQKSGEEWACQQQKKSQWKDKEAREVTLQGLSPLLWTLSLEGSPVDQSWNDRRYQQSNLAFPSFMLSYFPLPYFPFYSRTSERAKFWLRVEAPHFQVCELQFSSHAFKAKSNRRR